MTRCAKNWRGAMALCLPGYAFAIVAHVWMGNKTTFNNTTCATINAKAEPVYC